MLKAKDEVIKYESKTKLKAFVKPILRFILKPIGKKYEELVKEIEYENNCHG